MSGTVRAVNNSVRGFVAQIEHDVCEALGVTGCCNLTVTRYVVRGVDRGVTPIEVTLGIRVCVNGCEYHDLEVMVRIGKAVGVQVTLESVLARNVDPASDLTPASP